MKQKKWGRHERRFDWDEAKRLYDEGIPISWIAAKLRVSYAAVERVVVPGELEKKAKYQRENAIGKGVCQRCGAPTNKVAQYRGSRHCIKCANELRITSVREHELWCSTCEQWKPDAEFFSDVNRPHRRGRTSQCRACQVVARQQYRERKRQPCKGGCGRLISLSDQRASWKRRGFPYPKRLLGYCPVCRRKQLSAETKRQMGAAKFRKKFGSASVATGTTEN